MSSAPDEMPATELGGGFIAIKRGGTGAVLAPRMAAMGIVAIMSPRWVNARESEELSAWLAAFGLSDLPVAQLNQVHSAEVLRAAVATADSPKDADGLWAEEPDLVLSVKAADCAPIWLADAAGSLFALLHAGWQGTAAGIIEAAVEALSAAGTKPENLIVAIGPHLGPCCFEVGPEVADRFSRWPSAVLPATRLGVTRKRADSLSLDLTAAFQAQLGEAGVRREQIFAASACTRCREDFFHSYRRNGAGGPLMAAVAVRKR